MVTVGKQTAKSSSILNSKASTNEPKTTEITAELLAKRIQIAIERKYKVQIVSRQNRITTKVGHAVREKLGKDVQAQIEKQRRNGNGHGKTFDWKEWNIEVFPKILGEPDALKYSVEMIADAMSLLYDTISQGTEAAISDLVKFNSESLKRRNEFALKQEEQKDEIDNVDKEDSKDSDELEDFLYETSDEEDDLQEQYLQAYEEDFELDEQ